MLCTEHPWCFKLVTRAGNQVVGVVHLTLRFA